MVLIKSPDGWSNTWDSAKTPSISKTKAGGFICGDDLFWGEEFDFPVKRAVQEMVVKYKLSNVRNLLIIEHFSPGRHHGTNLTICYGYEQPFSI